MSVASLHCSTLPINWLDWSDSLVDQTLADGTEGAYVVRVHVGSSVNLQAKLVKSLSYDEHKQAERYRHPADQQRFTVGRGSLRWLVGYVTGQRPANVPLLKGKHGKLELPAETGWHVNVSHAGDWVLLALARYPVGIDVEAIRPAFKYQELLLTCFSLTEREALQDAKHRSDAAERDLFYTLWTRKEAILKATGLGMTGQLTAISVLDGLQTAPAPAIGTDDEPLRSDYKSRYRSWNVQSFTVTDQYPAALARPAQGPIGAFTLTDQ